MEEALQSQLVKELCIDLINGKELVIVNKERKIKISSMEMEFKESELIDTQLDRTS